MTLRVRITLIAAAAVALAVLAASLGIYLVTAQTLRGTVDRALIELAVDELAGPIDPSFRGGPRPGPFGGAGGTLQVVSATGDVLPLPPGVEEQLPVSDATIAAASGERDAFFETVSVAGAPVRILTLPAGTGLALQLARSLAEVETVLADLERRLLVVGLLGVALAAALGTVVSRRAVRPVDELTRIAEEVAATQDLSRRIGSGKPDEIGRLSRAFDGMLAQLEQARQAQQQLVADASHELRTPLTSLRTNVEVLNHLERLQPAERRQLVDDVASQIDEFARLIGSLVELARGERPAHTVETVRLDELAERVLARIPDPEGRIRLDAEPTTVTGEPERLERCLANLVDNARKYAPDGPIEVSVADRSVVVRDHGPGIAEADLPHVFERFYRSGDARGAVGSGLGLAIVEQVMLAHGGTVEAANAPEGGASFALRFPTHAPS